MSVTVFRHSHGLSLAAAKTTPHDVVAATDASDDAVWIVILTLVVILLERALPVGPAVVSVLGPQLLH